MRGEYKGKHSYEISRDSSSSPGGSASQGTSEPFSETRGVRPLARLWAVRTRKHRLSFLVCFDSVSSAIKCQTLVVTGLSPRTVVRPPGQPRAKGLRKQNDEGVKSTDFWCQRDTKPYLSAV